MAFDPDDVLVAKQSFFVGNDKVGKGERVRAAHPIVRGREQFFEKLTVQYDVEQATAAPGEKRIRSVGEYAGLKQPQLKALLDERGIDYPVGPVSNVALIALLDSE